jgi:hypothetical protein
MNIKIPEGYTLPEDVKDGGTFEELVTFKVEGNELYPTKIAGVEIPSDDSESEAGNEAETDMTKEEPMMAVSVGVGKGKPRKQASNPMKGMGERIMGMA